MADRPAHSRMRRADDDGPIQPYRPSLLRQPDDPGVEEEAERAGTRLALAALALVLAIATTAAIALHLGVTP